MAEVTSGMRLTVLVLQQHEADALAGLLHRWADDDTIDGDPNLWELYNAMVPCEDDEPIDYVPVARAESAPERMSGQGLELLFRGLLGLPHKEVGA